MAINDCRYDFKEMATSILPGYFNALKQAISLATPASKFVGFKSATKAALEQLNHSEDFPGCYVFLENKKPIYVGISRHVLNRLIQHLNYSSHYSASLVYRMASKQFPHKMTRDAAMKNEPFREVFNNVQEMLRTMDIAYIKIENDLELYLFEVYAAMKLNTNKWNCFRTH